MNFINDYNNQIAFTDIFHKKQKGREMMLDNNSNDQEKKIEISFQIFNQMII